MFSRFDRIQACDGRTNGRTDRQTSSHGIVRAMHTRRTAKIQHGSCGTLAALPTFCNVFVERKALALRCGILFTWWWKRRVTVTDDEKLLVFSDSSKTTKWYVRPYQFDPMRKRVVHIYVDVSQQMQTNYYDICIRVARVVLERYIGT